MPRLMMIATLIALVTLGGCSGGQTEGGDEQPVTIRIAYPVAVDAPVTAILDGYAREFMEENPGVQVETVYAGGYGDVRTAIQTAIDGGGDAPALGVMLATDLFDLANAQYIEPLTPYVDGMENGEDYLDDFLPAFLSNSYYMDELWSLPFQRSAVVMYYNADLLAERGQGVPTNWDTLGRTAAISLSEMASR